MWIFRAGYGYSIQTLWATGRASGSSSLGEAAQRIFSRVQLYGYFGQAILIFYTDISPYRQGERLLLIQAEAKRKFQKTYRVSGS